MQLSEAKRALLVGSSGMLGPVWLSSLTELGCEVQTADISDPNANFKLDLNSSSSIQGLVEQLKNLDIVVLNAGLDAKLERLPGDLVESAFDRQRWLDFFQVNVIGQAELISNLIPKLSHKSTIVAIGSMYGLVSPRVDVYNPAGAEGRFIKHLAYGSSKAALTNLMRQYAVQLAGRTSVNVLTLGVVDGGQPKHFRGKMTSQIPSGGFLQKDELGKYLAALITSSDLNFTGHNLVVDGGYTSW
jgi:NAD(P)-dependent dehydrogenase (short-subunit alcohol dehydrogenase family)